MKRHNKKGFTLIEIIISIGIIAIISIPILELFITAGNLNKRSYDIDKSVMISETIIEQFKLLENPNKLENMETLNNAYVLKNTKDNGYTIFYDGKWDKIKDYMHTDKNYKIVIKKAAYRLNIFVSDMNSSGIAKMNIEVIKNKFGYMEKKKDKTLYAVSTAKYFAGSKGGLKK